MQKIKKILALFCVFVMAIGVGSTLSFAGKTQSKPDVKVKLTSKSHCRGTDFKNDNKHPSTSLFYFKDYGYGLCAYSAKSEPDSGKLGTMSKFTNKKQSEKDITKCLYYFYKHDLYKNSTKLTPTEATHALRIHRYISYAQNGKASLKEVEKNQWHLTEEWVTKTILNNKAYNFDNIPSWFETYHWKPDNTSRQDVVLFKGNPGKGYIKKTSTEPINEKYYSFKGIQYAIFYDKTLTQKVTTLTLKEDGTSNTASLTPGTYYIQEVNNEALKESGFEWDETVYTKIIVKNKTAVIDVKDKPIKAKATIRKIMKDENMRDAIIDDEFYFHIVDVNNSKNSHNLKSDKATGLSETIELEPGTYEITEKLTEKQEKENIEKVTKPIIVTLKPGDNKTFEWVNKKNPKDTYLKVLKESLDGAKPTDFKFKVTGVLKDGSVYKDEKTGKNYTELEPYVRLKVKPGTYTVTEMLTPEQKAKYHHNDGEVVRYDGKSYTVKTSQTLKVEKDTTALFKFVNVPIEKAPVIKTIAKDKDTGKHVSLAKKNATVIDTVKYNNLVPGKEYTVNGELVTVDSKGTHKTGITTSRNFVPKDKDGSIDITFVFDASKLKGKKLVAFEKLSCDGKVVAKHEDPKDDNQTVYVPKIGTKATLKNSKAIDTVSYQKLVPGKYVLKGYMTIDGKKIDGTDGKVEFSINKNNASGTIDVLMPVDMKNFAGKKLVAFEELYLKADNGKEILVASHKDKNDINQSINIPGKTPPTGDDNKPYIYGGILVVALAAAGFVIYKKKKDN